MFKRNISVRGPIGVFGYNYLSDKIGADRFSKLRLLNHEGLRGAGGDYAYEVLNWAYWGMRTIDIRNMVSVTYGPVPMEFVLEFLRAAQDAGLVALSDTAGNGRLPEH